MTGKFDNRLVIGLTGGIGSGKSTALRRLVALGAEGIDADRVAHAVMAPDGAAYPALVEAFGCAVLAPDGRVDRQKLGRLVFTDAAALPRLESIVHPAVTQVVRARVAASSAPAVVIEAIKLLEAGLSRALCDQVWVTLARPEQQMARLIAERGMEAAEVQRRIEAQMPPADMAAQADRVIDTSGTLAETDLQVLRGWAEVGLPLPSVEVRPGTVDDAEGIAAVLNGIVREGGFTILDRTYSIQDEQDFLRGLPKRARILIATLAGTVCGFQIIEPYATYTGAMDHVATVGSFVTAGLRGQGIGRRLAEATFAAAREAGFRKILAMVRADNALAQAFYTGLGFRPCGRLAQQALINNHYVDELLFELFLEE